MTAIRIIKAIRMGVLITLLIASIYTIFIVTIPLLTSSIFSSILLVSLMVLIFLALREIHRIMTWEGY